MSQPMIQSLRFENLTFGYDDQHALFTSLDFDFPMNRTVWLNAQSGQGRSSLLQLLGVLRLPQSGRFIMNDMNIGDISFEEFLPYRLKIGYGFDFGGLLNNRTVLENMTLPLLYHKLLEPKAAKARAVEYLEYMGIGKYQDQRPAVVPGGVRKISCMVRAPIHHPEMLLLDDPSVGMNEATVLKYFDLVRKVKDQGSLQHVFISSFDKKLMSLLSATEVVIDDGKLFLNETTEKYAVNT